VLVSVLRVLSDVRLEQREATMSTRIRVIEANDFIKATSEGSLDLEESKRRLRAIATAIDPVVNYDAMLDTRQAPSSLSLADLWYLAAELNNLRKTFSRKLAVLCSPEQFNRAGFCALGPQNSGLPVQAFTSFVGASKWLTSEGPDV
jgi:hypothetical protein